MSTTANTASANPRELKDIATLLESIQKMADRVGTKSLSVKMGTIALYNDDMSAIVGYLEQDNGAYAFKTVSEHVEQREDDPVLEMPQTSAIPMLSASHDAIESTPRDLSQEGMEQTMPMSEVDKERAGLHAAV